MPKDVKPRAAAAKGKAAAKAPKDKNAPKKALSSYMIFSQEQRQTVKDENPNATFGELGKLLGAKWKSLSESEKAPYVDLAEKDKVRAANDASAYEKKGKSSNKKEEEASASDDE